MTRLPLAAMLLATLAATGCATTPSTLPDDLPVGVVAKKPTQGRAVRITSGPYAGAWMVPYTHRIPIYGGQVIEMAFEPIPGGEFKMGSPPDEPGRKPDEGPQVRVEVEPFWMGRYEVTWDQYDPYVRVYYKVKAGRDIPDARPKDLPADAVSLPTPIWEQDALPIIEAMGRRGGFPAAGMTSFTARTYSKWLSMSAGDTFFRLPTEAEWEYAARAGTMSAYFFGDDPDKLDAYAWYFDNSEWPVGSERGHPDWYAGYRKIGTKRPNPWGLHDVYGNVCEWCIDQHEPDHYGELSNGPQPVTTTDAIRWPTSQWRSVTRGGHWNSDAPGARSAARLVADREWSYADANLPRSIWHHTEYWMGMRVCRPLYPPAPTERLRYWAPADEATIEEMNGPRHSAVLIEWLDRLPEPQSPNNPEDSP